MDKLKAARIYGIDCKDPEASRNAFSAGAEWQQNQKNKIITELKNRLENTKHCCTKECQDACDRSITQDIIAKIKEWVEKHHYGVDHGRHIFVGDLLKKLNGG